MVKTKHTAKLAKIQQQLRGAATKPQPLPLRRNSVPATPGRSPDELMGQLAAQSAMQPPERQPMGQPQAENTVADDGQVTPEIGALITAQEAVVRPVLALFGIDYDSLISTQGNSLYGQALAARPELAQQVLASRNPVLAALSIAVGFKPYAEFSQQYGTTLDEVKSKMKAEALAELRAGGKEPAAPATGGNSPTLNVVFAGLRGQATPAPKQPGRSSLQDVFAR